MVRPRGLRYTCSRLVTVAHRRHATLRNTRLSTQCAVRRLHPRRGAGAGPVVGVLGCMAERLKDRLLDTDRLADIVAGPDAYRDLPRLIEAVQARVCCLVTESGLLLPVSGGGADHCVVSAL